MAQAKDMDESERVEIETAKLASSPVGPVPDGRSYCYTAFRRHT